MKVSYDALYLQKIKFVKSLSEIGAGETAVLYHN